MKELIINESFGGIMVLVPHQDDEILMAAGVLYQARKVGIPVHVVMVTNGDYECKDLSKGRARLRETIAGLKTLGLEPEALTILGYADMGMPKEDSFITHLFEEKEESRVYPSACGSQTYGLEEKADFHMERHGAHAQYSRKMLKNDLREVILEKKPEHIFTTSEHDLHGDHSGLCRFLMEILDEWPREEQPDLYCGLIHSCEGDERWPVPDTEYFTCPEGLEENCGCRWEERYVFSMPEGLRRRDGLKNLKYLALSKYETALEPNAVEFLMAFIKDEEIFWKIR